MAADDKTLRNLAAQTATVTPRPNVARLEQATLGDVEAMRLLLRGGSVIDWHRLSFSDAAEVDRFLALNEFDPDKRRRHGSPRGAARRRRRVPDAQLQLPHPRRRGPRHAGARSVPARLVARQEADVRVHRAQGDARHASPGRAASCSSSCRSPTTRCSASSRPRWSRSSRRSAPPATRSSSSPGAARSATRVVTKLLAKKATIAADVFDKLRFRLITRSLDDLPPVLHELLHRLIPFNYVIPGQTVNAILPFRRFLDIAPAYARFSDQLQLDLDTEERDDGGANEFSGPTYRVINFVADLPVRIDQFLCRMPGADERSRRHHLRAHRVPGHGRRDGARQRGGREQPREVQGAPARARQVASRRGRKGSARLRPAAFDRQLRSGADSDD